MQNVSLARRRRPGDEGLRFRHAAQDLDGLEPIEPKMRLTIIPARRSAPGTIASSAGGRGWARSQARALAMSG
jgi:hypothetical protein